MKRSEMLKVIMVAMDKKPDLSIKGITQDADKVLTAIEDAGMLPPFNSWAFITDGDHAKERDTIYCTWEKEAP